MVCTENGEENSTRTAPTKLRLTDLKYYRLGADEAPDARRATDEEFRGFITSVVGLGPGAAEKPWTVQRRRDVLNFAFALDRLKVENNILLRRISV